jgi:hypothetical protein
MMNKRHAKGAMGILKSQHQRRKRGEGTLSQLNAGVRTCACNFRGILINETPRKYFYFRS